MDKRNSVVLAFKHYEENGRKNLSQPSTCGFSKLFFGAWGKIGRLHSSPGKNGGKSAVKVSALHYTWEGTNNFLTQDWRAVTEKR